MRASGAAAVGISSWKTGTISQLDPQTEHTKIRLARWFRNVTWESQPFQPRRHIRVAITQRSARDNSSGDGGCPRSLFQHRTIYKPTTSARYGTCRHMDSVSGLGLGSTVLVLLMELSQSLNLPPGWGFTAPLGHRFTPGNPWRPRLRCLGSNLYWVDVSAVRRKKISAILPRRIYQALCTNRKDKKRWLCRYVDPSHSVF